MKLYSEASLAFIAKSESFLKEILSSETPYKLRRSRFEYLGHTYPIHIVVFTAQDKIGYFDPHTYQIGLHESLMYTVSDDNLKDIIRHELAHYLCYIMGSTDTTAHGPHFKGLCERFGWNETVSKASFNIDLELKSEERQEQLKLVKKVKALLKLAESDNVHEAELATLKANQLILKHNIKNLDFQERIIYSETLLIFKRRNAKLSTIYDIIKHFLVRPVLIYGKNQVALEVNGHKENIELAKHISHFLDEELERLWEKETSLKGRKAKNSFFMGIAKGYEQKTKQLNNEFHPSEQNALIKVQRQLDEDIKLIYKRLSYSKSSSTTDRDAYHKGKKKGQSLTIHSPIKNKAKTFLLNWSRT